MVIYEIHYCQTVTFLQRALTALIKFRIYTLEPGDYDPWDYDLSLITT